MSAAVPGTNGSEVHEDKQQKEEGCKCTTYEENFFRVCQSLFLSFPRTFFLKLCCAHV